MLALPHLSAPDITHIAWPRLAKAGFKGCVFDKARCCSPQAQPPEP